MKIKDITEEIVAEFSMFDDWMERYEYIIELGKNLVNKRRKQKTILLKAVNQKWLQGEQAEDKVAFTADSDILTKGIIAILIRTFSNQKC
jgi:cysteine desulfuration protein SufE